MTRTDTPSRVELWKADAAALLDIATGRRDAFDNIPIYPRLAFCYRALVLALLAAVTWETFHLASLLRELIVLESLR